MKLSRSKKAKVLALLRKAVQARVVQWNTEREIELLLDHEFEFPTDDLAFSLDEPTDAEVARKVLPRHVDELVPLGPAKNPA